MPGGLPNATAPSKPSGTPSGGRALSCRPRKAFTRDDGSSSNRATCDDHGAVSSTRLGPGSEEIPPTRPGTPFTFSAFQHMGDRKTQEDRYTVATNLEPEGRNPCAFFGVFDGTVGDFASENVKDLVVPKLLESPNWKTLRHLPAGRAGDQERLLENALRDMYRTVDESLLVRCAENTQHYATCTSVTLMVIGDVLAVGHLGDSRIVLGKEEASSGAGGSELIGEQLTMDHKPDQGPERQRIEQCGGMVERLQNHNNKPFIRGGDFTMRKALGEQPMQLQYSRAFGAKDLKIFGLSSVPDIRIIRMGSPHYRNVRYAILASDGLWDVMSAQQAVMTAHQAAQEDSNPAEVLVRRALLEQSRRKARADNITAICIQFD
mmetsp:Transcript_92320/g.270221  ORF Transcript_92320/g.270221 Transcript_92320/m.270221 type:complete len:377 (+) Transcript_92320:114-1244(+)